MTLFDTQGTEPPVGNAYTAADGEADGFLLSHNGARILTFGLVALVAVIAWLWFVFLVAAVAFDPAVVTLGPGTAYWVSALSWLGPMMMDNPILATLIKLCTPQFASGSFLWSWIAGFAMWTAMSFAMMLPSAFPMLRTYGDIALAANEKGEQVVTPAILTLGYLSAWIGFAVLASTLQLALIAGGIAYDPLAPLAGLAAGVILVAAGLYQFSSLREACLEKCRNPFTVLFGRWSNRPSAIWRLGLEQGLFCIGCCWALMLVMLVAGTMNLAWMAFLTLFAVLEKTGTQKVTSRISGAILLAWGGILSALAVGI